MGAEALIPLYPTRAPIASVRHAAQLLTRRAPGNPQEVGQLANEVNILGVMAVALFILVPVSFLLILFIKSSSEGNQSGGFSQEYYDASYKRCAHQPAAQGAGSPPALHLPFYSYDCRR